MPTSATQGAPHTSSGASSTIENLQALRGIAALLVVWTHLKFPLAKLCPEITHNTFIMTAHGAIGVDLFFIISGFVICLTACKRHHQPLDFLLARVARVSPLYLLITIPYAVEVCLQTWPNLPVASLWKGFFYLPLFDTNAFVWPPVVVGWTLSFEMWFYVAFALLLNLWKPDRVALYLPFIFGAGAAVMTLYQGSWYFPRFLFHPFVLEFAFGCIVFQTQRWIGRYLSWSLIATGIAYMLAFSRGTGYFGWALPLLAERTDLAWLRILLWGFPCALIVAGLVGLERNQGLTLPRFLVWLGGISYSLYLSHYFAMKLIVLSFSRLHLHQPVLVVASLLGSIFFFAWVIWRWMEMPLTRHAQAWVKKRVQGNHLTGGKSLARPIKLPASQARGSV